MFSASYGREALQDRVEPVDWVRGLAMVLMALGHALAFMGLPLNGEGLPGFRPEYPTFYHFVTRFLTHYAPTAFLFLAGVSVVFASTHRKDKKKSEVTISFHFVKRGVILVLLQFTAVNLAFSWDVRYYFGVLSMIGSIIIILSLLRLVSPLILILLTCITLTVLEVALKAWPFMTKGAENVMLEVLLYPNVGHGQLWVRYPILPWLGVGLLGCAFGRVQEADNEKVFRWAGIGGVGSLVLFGILRVINGFGNLRPRCGEGVVDFLVTSKYPPSISFLLWTLGGLGVTFFVLHHFRGTRFSKSFLWEAIAAFGKVPLFFYVVHILVYRILSMLPDIPRTLGWGYLVCLVGLVVMFPVCRKYYDLKRKHPRLLQYL